jgi:hypothetical protein
MDLPCFPAISVWVSDLAAKNGKSRAEAGVEVYLRSES